MLTSDEIAAKLGLDVRIARAHLHSLHLYGSVRRERASGSRESGEKWRYVFSDNALELVQERIKAKVVATARPKPLATVIKADWASGDRAEMARLSELPLARAVEPDACPCCGRRSGLIGGRCVDRFYDIGGGK